MRRTPWNGQDGFIREVLWLAFVVAVVAVVLLDAMAIFNAHQSSHDDAAAAARESQSAYAQTQSTFRAKDAARAYLTRSSQEFVAFRAKMIEGTMTFTVTDRAQAQTYVFKYFAHVPGMKDWVGRMLRPVSTESND
jgi:hypothetical protein